MNAIVILKAHPGIPVKDLARIFNTSYRTIYRDFESLIFAGFPVYSFPGSYGGYYIDENCFFPLLRFSPEEAASLFPVRKLSDGSIVSSLLRSLPLIACALRKER